MVSRFAATLCTGSRASARYELRVKDEGQAPQAEGEVAFPLPDRDDDGNECLLASPAQGAPRWTSDVSSGGASETVDQRGKS